MTETILKIDGNCHSRYSPSMINRTSSAIGVISSTWQKPIGWKERID